MTPPGAPRVAFIGSCQVAGMAAAARLMLPPGAAVDSYPVGGPLDHDAIISAVAGFDLIVTQVVTRADNILSATSLASQADMAVAMPVVAFTGFHPDMIYVADGAGRQLMGAWDVYHSRLAAAAFVAGLDAGHATRLFNAHVFAELDYLVTYPAAVQALTAKFAAHGFDISRLLARLLRRGHVFMHTINHPTMILTAHLTKLALLRAGLVSPGAAVRDDAADPLADGLSAPVLPPLAKRLGLPGSEVYRRSIQPGGASREVTLSDYVDESFRIYRGCAPELLRTPRILEAADILADLLA